MNFREDWKPSWAQGVGRSNRPAPATPYLSGL
jgi:hypothetical protein